MIVTNPFFFCEFRLVHAFYLVFVGFYSFFFRLLLLTMAGKAMVDLCLWDPDTEVWTCIFPIWWFFELFSVGLC